MEWISEPTNEQTTEPVSAPCGNRFRCIINLCYYSYIDIFGLAYISWLYY